MCLAGQFQASLEITYANGSKLRSDPLPLISVFSTRQILLAQVID